MSDLKKYGGVVVPMVTPLTNEFAIDTSAVKNIISSFIENKVQPLILGTTGEVASLSGDQKTTLIDVAIKEVDGKMPVVAGLCGNSLLALVEEGKKYADMGVEALVALAPNYYPVEDKHALNWFEQLADELPLPIFLYNIPATTHHSISLDVIEKLSYHANIIGIKDSQADHDRLNESLERWADREDFLFLVGCAANSCYGLQKGADGIVPSMGNLFPELYADLYRHAKRGDFVECAKSQKITDNVSKYSQGGRSVTEAIPALKALMSIKGLCGTQVMPPMLRMEKAMEKAYLAEMQDNVSNPMF